MYSAAPGIVSVMRVSARGHTTLAVTSYFCSSRASTIVIPRDAGLGNRVVDLAGLPVQTRLTRSVDDPPAELLAGLATGHASAGPRRVPSTCAP